MNRQERHAYNLGFACRALELPLATIMGPMRDDGYVLVELPDAYADAARLGYRDAVCTCDHHHGDHDDGYGCHGSLLLSGSDEDGDGDTVECFCTGFQSAALTKRVEQARNRAHAREEEEDARHRHAE